MARSKDGSAAAALIGGLIVVALIYQAAVWAWNWVSSRPPVFWWVLLALAVLFAAGAWAERREKPEEKNAAPVAGAIALAVLFAILGSCTAVQDRNAERDQERYVAENGGGSVRIVADDETCWTLTAYSRSQVADVAEADDVEVVFPPEAPEHADDEQAHQVEGCGSEDQPLPDDEVFYAVGLALDEDDDRHPIAWAALYWLMSNRTERPAFLLGGSISEATAYSTIPEAVYQSRKGQQRSHKTSNGFELTGLPEIGSTKLAKRLKLADAGLEALSDEAQDLANVLASSEMAGRQAEAFSRFSKHVAELRVLVDMANAQTDVALGRGDTAELRDFIDDLEAIEERGSAGRALATALRTVAYAVRADAASQSAEYGYYPEHFRKALKIIPQLRLIDPARESDTAELTARLDQGLARAIAEEEESDDWPEGGTTGFPEGTCGPDDIDGDSDGVCNES